MRGHRLAICLLNSYVNAAHEIRLRELVREELGDEIACSISSEVSPLAKEYGAGLDDRDRRVHEADLHRLRRAARQRPAGSRLHRLAELRRLRRPAGGARCRDGRAVPGGVLGPGRRHRRRPLTSGNESATPNLICADVGGTSCDISLVTDGQPTVNTTFELEHDLLVNALCHRDSQSLGAGGGSIVVDHGGRRDPGRSRQRRRRSRPGRYGKGGTEPTMTDAFLLIGILEPGPFAGGALNLDIDLRTPVVRAARHVAGPRPTRRLRLPDGPQQHRRGDRRHLDRATGSTRATIRLLAFGAAGPMMLPALLDETRVQSVIVPPHPGLFSALGLLSSDLVYADSRSSYQVLRPDTAGSIDAVFKRMEEGLRAKLARRHDVSFDRSFDGRLVGQTWETPFIDVPGGTLGRRADRGADRELPRRLQPRTGNRFDALPVQGVTYRVQARVPIDKVAYRQLDRANGGGPTAGREITLRWIYGEEVTAANTTAAPHAGDTISRTRDHSRGAVDHAGLPRANPPGSESTASSLSRGAREMAETIYQQPETLVRDLSDAEFEARYHCDRFTASVLGSRFRYVVQHMCTGPAQQRLLGDLARLVRLRGDDRGSA